MSEVVKVLDAYGPWGMTAVCLFAIWRMALYIKQLFAEMRQESKESVTALVETREAMIAFRDAMERLVDRVKEIDHVEMAHPGEVTKAR